MLSLLASLLIQSSIAIDEIKQRPNIIFMLIDDLGWNDLSYNGGCDYQSLNIDELAKSGLILNNYYIQHRCSPTRSALMSARYPIHDGLQNGVIRPTSPYGLPLDLKIIPQDLKAVGYDTHMIGKWHLGFFTPDYLPTSRGFDSFFGFYLGGMDYYYHNRSYQNVEGYDLRNNTKPIMRANQYSTYLHGNESLRILSHYAIDQQTNPFFLYLSFQAVHSPLTPPQHIVDHFNDRITSETRQKKAAMVTVLDDVIGEIVDYLQSEESGNLWESTMLIFSTDNGGPVDHNAGSNFPLRGSKGTLWEGGVKGIGFVTGGWLNDQRRGQQMNALMHITDWYPTLCAIAGCTVSSTSIDGYDQSENIWIGETNYYSPRSEILHNIDPMAGTDTQCEHSLCGAVRWQKYKLVIGAEVSDTNNLCKSGWCALPEIDQNMTSIQCSNDGNYNYPTLNESYITSNCPYNGKGCLYDIESDPCEYHDLSQEQELLYEQLLNLLREYNKTMVTPLSALSERDPEGADPSHLDGFWGPWQDRQNISCDADEQNTTNAAMDDQMRQLMESEEDPKKEAKQVIIIGTVVLIVLFICAVLLCILHRRIRNKATLQIQPKKMDEDSNGTRSDLIDSTKNTAHVLSASPLFKALKMDFSI